METSNSEGSWLKERHHLAQSLILSLEDLALSQCPVVLLKAKSFKLLVKLLQSWVLHTLNKDQRPKAKAWSCKDLQRKCKSLIQKDQRLDIITMILELRKLILCFLRQLKSKTLLIQTMWNFT